MVRLTPEPGRVRKSGTATYKYPSRVRQSFVHTPVGYSEARATMGRLYLRPAPEGPVQPLHCLAHRMVA